MKNWCGRFSAALIFLMIVLASARCGGGGTDDNSDKVDLTPTVAIVGDFSGSLKPVMLDVQKGVEFGLSGARSDVKVAVYDTGGSRTKTYDLYFGKAATATTDAVSGIYDDPKIVGTIFVDSMTGFVISGNSGKNEMLKVGTLSTATSLMSVENLVLLSAMNDTQGKGLYNLLTADAVAAKANMKVAIVTQSAPRTVDYALDLLLNFQSPTINNEITMIDANGQNSDGTPAYFPQVISTITIQDDSNGNPVVPSGLMPQLKTAGVNAIVFIGFADGFKAAFEAASAAGLTGVKWYASDGVYNSDVLKISGVANAVLSILAQGGRDSSSASTAYASAFATKYGTAPNASNDYGYDAGKYIAYVFSNLGSASSSASIKGSMASAAKGVSYAGITGTKGLGVKIPGRYDVFGMSGGAFIVKGTAP